MVKNPATSLKRALSSTARMFVIQGLRHGRWSDVYCYSAEDGQRAKSVFGHIITVDTLPREIKMFRDFRLLPPVPDKLIKKAKTLMKERRAQRRQEAAAAFRPSGGATTPSATGGGRKRHQGGRSGAIETTGQTTKRTKGKGK